MRSTFKVLFCVKKGSEKPGCGFSYSSCIALEGVLHRKGMNKLFLFLLICGVCFQEFMNIRRECM